MFENILIHPYQYAWFNFPSRILNLGENFELDYWGISSRNLAKKANKIKLNGNKEPCILIGVWSSKSYLDENIFTCKGPWSAIDSDFPRPFFAIQNVRNLRKGRSYRCQTIYDEKIKLLPFNQELLMGRIIKCN